jgi:hypothetical protein
MMATSRAISSTGITLFLDPSAAAMLFRGFLLKDREFLTMDGVSSIA